MTPSKNSISRLKRVTGKYFSTRRVHKRLAKLGALLRPVEVALTEEGVLKTISTNTTRWIETKPLTFTEEHGSDTLVFRQNDKGKITHMFLGSSPYLVMERIGFKDSPTLHKTLAVVAFIFFFATTVSWPFAAVIRWQHKIKLNPWNRIPRWAYFFAWSASFLFIVMAAFLTVGLNAPNAVLFGIPMWMKMTLVLSIISVILAVGALIYTIVIWISGKGSIWGRIYYTSVTLAMLSATWQLNHWNLLGFRY